MDFKKIYENTPSYYEVGMAIDIKDYLKECNEIKDFSVEFKKNEFIIRINGLEILSRIFLYQFLEYISYDYLCMVHKEIIDDFEIFYILTMIENDSDCVKIQMRIKNNN